MTDRLTIAAATAALARTDKPFIEIFRHGTLAVEFYKPVGVDLQTPHSRDEVYAVVAGSGTFFCGGVRRPFERGEVLFAAAGIEHRFENFTPDFATWVFFYGPEGGEAGQC
jgi:mannose-6-phosphate isomerase-like protein (cupin superfamily)